MPDQDSAASLRAALDAVREQIDRAAARAGRSASDVTLVAVTKTYPVETVRAAAALGLADFGENRVGELVEKSNALPGEALGGAVRWHAIGSLQRNKAREVAARADLFHALDSLRLAEALDAQAARAARVLPVLVQVNISGEGSKGGVPPEAAHDLMAAVSALDHLRLAGVMGMAAPAAGDAERERIVRPAFAALRRLFETYAGPGRDGLSTVSMGMSDDFEMAVEEGATHVRVGSALFGARPPVPARQMP
jgi:pyridoxal phosphate enzyme (YggS family)